MTKNSTLPEGARVRGREERIFVPLLALIILLCYTPLLVAGLAVRQDLPSKSTAPPISGRVSVFLARIGFEAEAA